MYDRALAKLGDRDAADSIRQRTFITVFEKLDQFRGESTLSAWIMKIGGRTSVNYVKSPEHQRRQRGETVPLRGASSEDSWDLILNRPGIQAPDQTGTPLEKVLSRERGLQVKQALSLLKPQDRLHRALPHQAAILRRDCRGNGLTAENREHQAQPRAQAARRGIEKVKEPVARPRRGRFRLFSSEA